MGVQIRVMVARMCKVVRFGVYFEGRTNRIVEESNTGCEIKRGERRWERSKGRG